MIKTTCPNCKGPLVLLTSVKKKICVDCIRTFDWPLDKGQKAIFTEEKGK